MSLKYLYSLLLVFNVSLVARLSLDFDDYSQNDESSIVLGTVERVSLDHELQGNEIDIAFEVSQEHDIPLCSMIVVGGGSAGYAAVLYGSRLFGSSVIISGPQIGGQLTGSSIVENWPGILPKSGLEIMEDCKKQAEQNGAMILEDEVVNIDLNLWPYLITCKSGKKLYALSLVMATGANPKRLGCDGESEYWGRGVSTCAICDAPLFKNKKVIVVGGGDSACEEALQLAPYASKVYMAVRKDKMRASEAMQKRIHEEDNIEVLYSTEVTHIHGDGKKIISVDIISNKKSKDLKVDGFFIAIGHEPNNKLIKDKVELDEQGLIICGSGSQKTSVPGVFAAGDIENMYRQAGVAAGNGIKAGIDAFHFLQDIGWNSKVFQKHKNLFYGCDYKHIKKDDQVKSSRASAAHSEFAKEKIENPFDILEKKLVEIFSYSEFQKVMKSKGRKLIQVSTRTCPACKVLKKNLQTYIHSDEKEITPVYYVDLSNVPQVGDDYDISSVPVLLFVDGSEVVHEEVGSLSVEEVKSLISEKFQGK